MPSIYTPTRKVTGALTVPVDGDNVDGASFASPLQALADRALYAASIAASNWRSEAHYDLATGSAFDYVVHDIACGLVTDGSGRPAPLVLLVGGGPSIRYAAWRHECGGPWSMITGLPAYPYGACFDPVRGWVICGDSTGTSAYAAVGAPATLPTAFTTRATNSTLRLNACASNGAGVIVCVGEGGGGAPHIERTIDGVTFSAQTAPLSCNLVKVIFAAGAWIAVGNIGGTAPVILRSTDGVTWTQRPVTGAGSAIAGVCHDGAKFVACTALGHIVTSPDGLSWSSDGVNKIGYGVTGPLAGARSPIAADPVSGVLVANAGGSPLGYGLALSFDGGATWSDVPPPALLYPAGSSGEAWALAFGQRRFFGGGVFSGFFESLAR